jgi:hypothetical protein
MEFIGECQKKKSDNHKLEHNSEARIEISIQQFLELKF